MRNAFVQVLQAKAVLANARENLGYWDNELSINRSRFSSGDLAQVDLNRLELQRVQFEVDVETATVNLRTAKIQLLALLNSREAVDSFDVEGLFDFQDTLLPLEEVRASARDARPDLLAAAQNVDLANLSHRLAIANGSTDPTFNVWWTHNSSFNNPYDFNSLGVSVSIPLRIFDKNQAEKARTQIEIGRSEKVRDAVQAQVFSDVDTAYYTLVQALNLLKPYRAKYLPLAGDNRDRISFS